MGSNPTPSASDPKADLDYGELAESVEGARLLSEYTGQNLYRGFESLALRHCALIAQPDRVFGYEPKGRRFESCWAHQVKIPLPIFVIKKAKGFLLA